MPEYEFVCQLCGYRTFQRATQVSHRCPKNNNIDTDLINTAEVTAVDIFCDGCDAEHSGEEHHVFSEAKARASATIHGWSCDKKTGDWCPRCVAEKKVPA